VPRGQRDGSLRLYSRLSRPVNEILDNENHTPENEEHELMTTKSNPRKKNLISVVNFINKMKA
jgi:hypothetical protein